MNDIRRERTKEMYINIVCDLICEEGMSAVTIRSISEKAGYNSATLYSYFESLPHLILCAQLKFEERLLAIFQQEIEEKKITSYYEVWPHMYALMAKYYLENPNIFDCGFVADFAVNNKNEIREQRRQKSEFEQYVGQSLARIAQETGKDMGVILQINNMCIAQVAGMVLLYTKSRMDTSQPINIERLEHQLRSMIKCFMEEPSYER